MSASRVRIRPPHSHEGMIVLAALVGVAASLPVAGYVVLWFLVPGFFGFFQYNFWIINSIQAAIALVPLAFYLMWLVRRCQHARWCAAAGVTYALSVTAFSMLWIDMYMPWLAWVDLAEYVLLVPIAAVLGALLALATMHVQRTIFSRALEQDGTLCNHCGYPVTHSSSTTCPECGGEVGDISPTRIERFVAWLGQRPRSVTGLLVAVLVLGNGLVAWTEYDHRTLRRSLGEGWVPLDTPSIDSGELQSVVYRDATLNGEEAAIIVELARRPVWRRRNVQIRMAHIGTWADGSPRYLAPGHPRMVVHVPRANATAVLRNGPPQDVIERLLEAARDAQWRRDMQVTETHTIEVSWDAAAGGEE